MLASLANSSVPIAPPANLATIQNAAKDMGYGWGYMYGNSAQDEQEKLFEEAANQLKKDVASGKFAEESYMRRRDKKTPAKTKLKLSFQLLGLNPNATQKEVRRRYRKLCLKLHPDKVRQRNGSNDQSSTADFHRLREAYERIMKKFEANL